MDWANNLGLVSFWRYFRGEYSNLPKLGVGAPRGPHGGPKGPKMAKIDQNLNFFWFCHHPFNSGKRFLLLFHSSNVERVEENERWEWRPRGPNKGVLKSQKWLKSLFSLLLHWSNAERVVENERREWRNQGAQQGGPKGPKMTKSKTDQNLEFV